MTDLVERLRRLPTGTTDFTWRDPDKVAAADEIERLKQQAGRHHMDAAKLINDLATERAEVEWLNDIIQCLHETIENMSERDK